MIIELTKKRIAYIIAHYNKESHMIDKKIQTKITELSMLIQKQDKDTEILSIALAGHPSDQEHLCRTNRIPDVLGNVLEAYERRNKAQIEECQNMITELMDMRETVDFVWNTFQMLDAELYEILKLRYCDGLTWDYLQQFKGMSKREISEKQRMALDAIYMELKYHDGCSKKVEWKSKVKDKCPQKG